MRFTDIRGEEPGRQAEDWFQAQGEVLEFLIEEESRHAAEETQVVHAMAASSTGATAPEPIEQTSRPVEQTAANAESETSLGVWSATEPDSAKLAPPLGKATEFQIDGPKQSSGRATTKSASPRKSTAKAEGSATEGSAKKTTRRAAAKKDAGSPKPKKTRKKAEEPTTAGNE